MSRTMSEPTPPPPTAAAPPARPPRAVTVRSVIVGLLGVGFICGLTPYNDYAMANTFLVGNALPVGLLLFVVVVVLGVNAPLLKLAPRLALGGGELAVALGMALVSCALPSSGLMRYLPASLVGIYHQAGTNADDLDIVRRAGPPDWVLPRFGSETVQGRANDPIVTDYRGRSPRPDDSLRSRVNAVPWAAWRRPAVAWAVFLGGLYGAVMCGATLVRRQWVENERLAFPLAGVYLSLIEPPAAGRAVNQLFRSRGFWIAAGAVFVAHSLNGLNAYFPKVPAVPLGYDFTGLFADAPLSYLDGHAKQSAIYFSMIGITYFLQSKVAFSLWGTYLALEAAQVYARSGGGEITAGMQQDQQFGAIVAYTAAALWIGRRHWALIGRQMLRGRRGEEPAGRYLPYAAAGWGLAGCAAVMVVWLIFAGMSAAGAAVAVGMLLLLMFAISRVVAETGLIFAQFLPMLYRPWTFLLLLPTPVRTTDHSFFFTAWLNQMLGHDMREAAGVYDVHALRMADGGAYWGTPGGWRAAPFLLCLALAMVVGYVVSGAATLYVDYNYAAELGERPMSPINPYGVDSSVRWQLLDVARAHLPPAAGPVENHSRPAQFAFGAGLTAALSYLRLRYGWWPFGPVGFLVVYSYSLYKIWFSIFLGWGAKVLVVRLGGATLLRKAKPVFLGLVLGEAGAAAAWLTVSLVLNALGLPFHAVNLLPT